MQFHEKRRQQFLNQLAFEHTSNFFRDTASPGFLQALQKTDSDLNDRRRVSAALADYSFTNYMLSYTAGADLNLLRDELTGIVANYEQATRHVQAYANDPTFPPLRFAEIDQYERALQLIGLCYLLHRRDLLPRIAATLDGAFAGRDTLYEDLLAYELTGRYEVDEWYHDKPYRDIINSLYRDTPEERIADIGQYLKMWYPSMKRASWHDSHLSISEEDGCGAYFGYWSVEAAAVTYLLELDDTSFREHIVYPKDLVDFARTLDSATHSASSMQESESARIRVEGGQPCPRAGHWSTPALQDSRRHFEQGEIMPVVDGAAYGATIWQWSDN